VKWKIYYSDGKTISSEDATPFSIERRVGVQVIVQEDPEKGWLALPPYDYYMFGARGGAPKWFPGDQVGLFQYITQPGSKCILLGEWVDDIIYRKILNRATEDRMFACKTGYAPWERQP
jgi:hypothetical protein